MLIRSVRFSKVMVVDSYKHQKELWLFAYYFECLDMFRRIGISVCSSKFSRGTRTTGAIRLSCAILAGFASISGRAAWRQWNNRIRIDNDVLNIMLLSGSSGKVPFCPVEVASSFLFNLLMF